MTIQFRNGFFCRHAVAATFVTGGLALSFASVALAQTAPSPAPSDAPPRLERLEEGAPAGTPQAPSDGKGTTEKRNGTGEVNEIEVRTGVSTYYLRPNNQVGNSQQGDQQSSGNRAAQYRVKEFDLGRKKAPATAPAALPAADETVTPPTIPAAK